MDADRVRRIRLASQHITAPSLADAAAVVTHQGAMQAQEFAMALWAVGLRSGLSRSAVADEFQRGTILRTHLLRPTWHFVAPLDIRWLLRLTAPRVHRRNAPYYARNDLDGPALSTAVARVARTLTDGGPLTRTEIAERLTGFGIEATGQRLALIMMCAELDEVICSGPRRGKQFTYRLLDEAAPPLDGYSRERAIGRIAERFVTSRGIVSAHDLSSWSGLTVRDSRLGLESLGGRVTSVDVGGRAHSALPALLDLEYPDDPRPATFLLPDYDEYVMSYRDRAFLAADRPPDPFPSDRSHWVVVRGRIAGTWAPTPGGADVTPFGGLGKGDRRDVEAAVAQYEAFLG